MLAGGETVVIAASGGPDSTALVHALAALGPDLALTIHLAHLNHRLRSDAAEDAAFVAALARALGLEHHQGSADPRTLADREGLSLEDASRRLRYEFLIRVAHEAGAAVVATGHTLDDQAETVLMRLLRGSGLVGLTGIPPVREDGTLRIIRPLIDTTREEVQAYLESIGAGWREDATNRDLAILRNRIRLVLLPILEGYNPDVRHALARVAALLRDEAEAIDTLATPHLAEVLSGGSPAVRVAAGPFARLPVALQRRAIRGAVERARGNLRAIRFVHIEEARRLALEGETGAWLSLPGGVRVTRLADGVEVSAVTPAQAPGAYRLPVPGRVVALEFGVHLTAEAIPRDRLRAGSETSRPDTPRPDEVVLDAIEIGGELIVRGPQPGDRFAPAGMGGRTKLVAEYLSDEKVPRHRRPFTPVLATPEGAILWIVGMRAAETAQVTPATARAVRVVARRLRAEHVL